MFDFTNLAPHLLVTGSLLVISLLVFIVFFLVPGFRHGLRLKKILTSVRAFKRGTLPTEFKKLFASDAHLAHLWSEYNGSLHPQQEEHDGQMRVVAYRSSIPAEMYFCNQYVVDSRLYSEFFKHLPGIFTGLGIIGTFFGIIEGLKNFHVSENAATVRASLESLMHSVGGAFFISASAIMAAMAVTVLEKFILTALYQKTEEIAQAIDTQFDAGVGVEYLSRVVTASEGSASHVKILKDALVRELGDILRELTASQLATGEKLNMQLIQRIEDATNKQVAAAREDKQTLGEVIAGSIEKSLKEPLEAIASTVKTATGDQSASAVQMLNDVMVSFSQRLNDLFGGQINGINELNKQTAQGMQNAVNSLNALVGKMEESGKRTTDEMAVQMAASIRAMEERQGNINGQTQALVDQISKLVETSQAETQQKLQSTLESLGQHMSAIMGSLNESQSRVFESNRTREEAMSNRAMGLVSDMAESGKRTTNEMTTKMAASIKAMEERQGNINDQTQAFVGQISKLVESSQAETQEKLQSTLESLGQHMTAILGSLSESQSKVFESNRTREEAMANRATGMVADMAGSVEAAVKEMATASQTMAQSVSTLTTVTTSSVDKMSIGADRLSTAATSFASAGDRVTGVMGQAATVSTKLAEVSGSLTTSAGAVQEALSDYRMQREAVSQLLADVRATIELARKEASLTADVLQRIEASTTKLGNAHKAADEYLDGVNQVLADSSDAFRESVVSTLSKVNHDFHTKLSSAVGLLSTAVQELEVTLGSLAPRR